MRHFWLALALGPLALPGCNGDKDDDDTGAGDDDDDDDDDDSGELTLDNCETNIDADVPAFYQTYFHCVDISMSGTDVVITTDGLPPHKSAYYDASDPNHETFDTSGGRFQNPNRIASQTISITIPAAPTAKGLTIDGTLVDQQNNSGEEFPLGPAGAALDGVAYFAGFAAPGDQLEDEEATFDAYEGHPEMSGTYHYHGASPGPLEVLDSKGIDAGVELYAVMCDGTIVLGCNELDGTSTNTADFDSQNGHVHDVGDGSETFFTGRYHTHVCPGTGNTDFAPEIAYYDEC